MKHEWEDMYLQSEKLTTELQLDGKKILGKGKFKLNFSVFMANICSTFCVLYLSQVQSCKVHRQTKSTDIMIFATKVCQLIKKGLSTATSQLAKKRNHLTSLALSSISLYPENVAGHKINLAFIFLHSTHFAGSTLGDQSTSRAGIGASLRILIRIYMYKYTLYKFTYMYTLFICFDMSKVRSWHP